MPPVKETPSSPVPSNVHVLKAAAAPSKVQPPDGWLLEGPFGHMAFEAGEAGRLVRLADVLRWLQSSQEIPRSEALQVLCGKLTAEVMDWLYWLQPTARATPVPALHQFGFSTVEQIAARKEKDTRDALQKGLERERQHGRFGVPLSMQNSRISFGYPESTEPGLPALLKYLRSWWSSPRRTRASTCDILDDPKLSTLTLLAIRLDKAHALWGYGRVAVIEKAANMPTIDPLDGWKVNGKHGYMAFDDTPAGRVITLADVVTWVIENKQQPCGPLVDRLCNAIKADDGGWLYVVQAANFAKPLTKDHSFAWESSVTWLDDVPAAPKEADCGVPGLVKHLASYWGTAQSPSSANYMGQEVLDSIAMPITKAHELFEYGTVVEAVALVSATVVTDASPATVRTYGDLVEHRKVNKGAPWLGAHVDLMAREIDLRTQQGQKGVRSGIGKELGGISPARISELLKKERKRQPALTSTQHPGREAA